METPISLQLRELQAGKCFGSVRLTEMEMSKLIICQIYYENTCLTRIFPDFVKTAVKFTFLNV